jgi:hypothetical protein
LEDKNAAKSRAKKRKNKDDKNLPSDDAEAARYSFPTDGSCAAIGASSDGSKYGPRFASSMSPQISGARSAVTLSGAVHVKLEIHDAADLSRSASLRQESIASCSIDSAKLH